MQWLAETAAQVSQQDGAPVDDRISVVALCMLLVLFLKGRSAINNENFQINHRAHFAAL